MLRLLTFLLAVSPAFGAFSYYRSVTIDHTQCGATNSSSFPVTVSLTDNTLKVTGSGGHVQSSTGYDIYFYSDSGLTTRIPAYREYYSGTAGTYIGKVKVGTVSHTVDTVIYMAYGDAGIVTDPNANGTYGGVPTFSNSYSGVWLLPDGTTPSFVEVENGYNGTNSGTTAAAGKVDGGVAIAPSKFFTASGANLNGWTAQTIAFWINLGASSDAFGRIIEKGSNTEWTILTNPTGSDTRIVVQVGTGTSLIATSADYGGAFHHVVVTIDASFNTILYIDGANAGTGIGVSGVTNGTVNVGQFGGGSFSAQGTIDNITISSVVRSADWVTTEFNNQSTPGNIGAPGFYTVGSEQTPAVSGVVPRRH